MESVEVRSYLPADREAVLALAPRLTEGVAAWRDPAAVRDAVLDWVVGSIDGAGTPDRLVLVADAGGRVVGFVTGVERTHWSGSRDAYIGELVVGATAEGRGVGRALVDGVCEWARTRALGAVTPRDRGGQRTGSGLLRRDGLRGGRRTPDTRSVTRRDWTLMNDEARRRAELARAWDEAAAEYERYFVPRFAPWVAMAVEAVADEIPSGPILVPCCGTFPELPVLAAHHPEREIIGIDLSAGMVRLAQDRATAWPRATARVGDATTLSDHWAGAAAGVVSVFGLQQLPDPPTTLADWAATLRPGGVLSVAYWPTEVEPDGPFAVLDQILSPRREPAGDAWEDRLDEAVAGAGATIVRHDDRSYPMEHADAETFWDAMTTGGPLRALENARGAEFMRVTRAEFLQASPAGPWRHEPRARLLVARR